MERKGVLNPHPSWETVKSLYFNLKNQYRRIFLDTWKRHPEAAAEPIESEIFNSVMRAVWEMVICQTTGDFSGQQTPDFCDFPP